jgi:hypothetical protein
MIAWVIGLCAADLPQGAVTTLTGSGVTTPANFQDGARHVASFSSGTSGLAAFSNMIAVAGYNDHRIRLVNATNGQVTTLAGSGSGSADGVGTNAAFNRPSDVSTGGSFSDYLFVADSSNHRIRRVRIRTGATITIAGSGNTGSFVDATGTNARFSSPGSLKVVSNTIYVADVMNHRIRAVALPSMVVTTLAGSGTTGDADGTGTSASFERPTGLAVNDGVIYVSDAANNVIRKIVISTKVVTTLAGSGSTTPFSDGTGTAATFFNMKKLEVHNSMLYLASNDRIRQVDISSGAVTTFAGTGTKGYMDDPVNAMFDSPRGVTVSPDGKLLYVMDSANGRIREVSVHSRPAAHFSSGEILAYLSTDHSLPVSCHAGRPRPAAAAPNVRA